MTPALASLGEALKTPTPWLDPYIAIAGQVASAAPSGSVADALNTARGASLEDLRFVAQTALPEGEPYESFIFRTGCIPTRDNLHDLFNGLMWLSYPQTKRQLNILQAQQLATRGNPGSRGPLRDALTLFDENAAILRAPTPLLEALRQRNWKGLFLDQREQWAAARLVIFGHALMEKLLQPYKAITAHVWVVDAISDESLAASLDPSRLAAKDFLPLPVLGVPGWWPANEAPGFYDDADVFRRPRRES
ncbi:DUF3025 domain-containing protein [Steroidobacter sp. S1-65]|uniref:DUF3025 domain-containing protein n=1 Tax=Steroidobacter gossypii TaxID=2805490 RepID=A0ABS1WQI3_9GAMM|nr:DUF3025 domain-containing protein [Steroidobacter gossypii]MBM0103207.1 DUF3025 domain-containing protein [Steroidobacter gossypii]